MNFKFKIGKSRVLKNSDWSFNMGVYEKFFFYYFGLLREMSNTRLENDM